MSLRFLILCNNDFGVIVKIVINENGNYFFVAQKTATISEIVAAYEDSYMYVGTRRNGVGAFLVQLFGYKKSLQG